MWHRELPLEAKYHAVIVETRQYPNFGEIVRGHLKFTPEDFALTVFCGLDNESFVRQELHGLKFNLIKLSHKDLSEEKYNRLLTSYDFWDSIGSRQSFEVEKVLIFQVDSMLLRHGLKDFMKWCFIGSPWKWQHFGCNGGLSLRTVKTMKEICRLYTYNLEGNEDVWFGNVMMNKKIGNLAPREECEKFACEAIFRLNTIGFHAIEKWLTTEECNQIKNQYK